MPLPRILHKITSPLLYKLGLYQQLWRARSRREPFSFVLMYHRVVADVPPGTEAFKLEKGISAADFERQMRFLLQHFTPVAASRIQSDLGKEIQFAVTLDDGYEDNYQVAAPILKKLGIPATFYVVSDFVGTDRLFWWEQIAELVCASRKPQIDLQAVIPELRQKGEQKNVLSLRDRRERDYAYEQLCARIREGPHVEIPSQVQKIAEYFDAPLREEGRRYGLMDWHQLKDLVMQGFEIGGHSASHCNVIGAGEDLLQRELIESASAIEAKVDAPVETFAYPYGLFEASNKLVTSLLGSTNCKAAFTTARGVVKAGLPAYELPRMELNRPYDFACAFNIQDSLNCKLAPASQPLR